MFVGSSASEDDALEAAMNAGAEDVQAVRDEEEQLEGHKASITGMHKPALNSTAALSVNLAASCFHRGIRQHGLCGNTRPHCSMHAGQGAATAFPVA